MKLTKKQKKEIEKLNEIIEEKLNQQDTINDEIDELEQKIRILESGGVIGKKVYILGEITGIYKSEVEGYEGEEVYNVKFDAFDEEYNEFSGEIEIEDVKHIGFAKNQFMFKEVKDSKVGSLM